jgi:hypothetical protein
MSPSLFCSPTGSTYLLLSLSPTLSSTGSGSHGAGTRRVWAQAALAAAGARRRAQEQARAGGPALALGGSAGRPERGRAGPGARAGVAGGGGSDAGSARGSRWLQVSGAQARVAGGPSGWASSGSAAWGRRRLGQARATGGRRKRSAQAAGAQPTRGRARGAAQVARRAGHRAAHVSALARGVARRSRAWCWRAGVGASGGLARWSGSALALETGRFRSMRVEASDGGLEPEQAQTGVAAAAGKVDPGTRAAAARGERQQALTRGLGAGSGARASLAAHAGASGMQRARVQALSGRRTGGASSAGTRVRVRE